MTDEQHNTPQPVEHVSLTELYQAIPDRLADSEEVFDVEAGLADLHSWIDAQDVDDTAHTTSTQASSEVVLTTGEIRDLQAARSLSPELADRWLNLAERRVALEEAHAEAETLALRHRLDEETRQSAHRRELEAADAAHQRTLALRALDQEAESALAARRKQLEAAEDDREVKLRELAALEEETRSRLEFRSASRRLWTRAFAIAIPSVAWSIGFVISVINQLNQLTLVFSFGLIGLGSIYGSAVALVARTAATAKEPDRRHDAARVLSLLLFREGGFGRSGPSAEEVAADTAIRKRRVPD